MIRGNAKTDKRHAEATVKVENEQTADLEGYSVNGIRVPSAAFRALERLSAPPREKITDWKPPLEEAAQVVSRYLVPSPLRRSGWLSDLTGGDIWMKMDCLNPTGSFKVRGALNALAQRRARLRQTNVPQSTDPMEIVAASAGNHAQGVAYAAREMGCRAHIFLPKGTPLRKQQQTENLGAQVYVVGESLDEAFESALQFVERTPRAEFLHPFNDFDVIAGQATCLIETLQQFAQSTALPTKCLHHFICSIGGGGLAAGSALAMAFWGGGTVIGVEQESFDSARNSLDLKEWKGVSKKGHTSLADGIRVQLIGRQNHAIISETIQSVELVTDDDLVMAMTGLMENENLVVEGAGAAGVAHVLREPGRYRDKKTVICLSGGNVDPQLFGRVLSRGLGLSGRLMRVALKLGDKPGQLAHTLARVAETEANILEVHHDRTYSKELVGDVGVELTLETRNFAHQDFIMRFLQDAGFLLRRI